VNRQQRHGVETKSKLGFGFAGIEAAKLADVGNEIPQQMRLAAGKAPGQRHQLVEIGQPLWAVFGPGAHDVIACPANSLLDEVRQRQAVPYGQQLFQNFDSLFQQRALLTGKCGLFLFGFAAQLAVQRNPLVGRIGSRPPQPQQGFIRQPEQRRAQDAGQGNVIRAIVEKRQQFSRSETSGRP
jgi:hypothetical protein